MGKIIQGSKGNTRLYFEIIRPLTYINMRYFVGNHRTTTVYCNTAYLEIILSLFRKVFPKEHPSIDNII